MLCGSRISARKQGWVGSSRSSHKLRREAPSTQASSGLQPDRQKLSTWLPSGQMRARLKLAIARHRLLRQHVTFPPSPIPELASVPAPDRSPAALATSRVCWCWAARRGPQGVPEGRPPCHSGQPQSAANHLWSTRDHQVPLVKETLVYTWRTFFSFLHFFLTDRSWIC